ncbi:MAG: Mur ligase family protein [Myxococcota bacterium]|nr:Mur ligase family protein [Myxococcota bacterium]
MHVHLIGVAGTGMGALAGLLQSAGHRVTGSDTAFYPPMGEALARWGIETRRGWDAANVADAPDLVVVGNVCRRDNPEARAAIDGGLRTTSMPGVIEELFLADRPGWVVAGTHGKTTATTLLAFLLHRLGRDPGMLVGGIPKDFAESFRLGDVASRAPFVIEGDEYDSAFFEKTPKMWRYQPHAAILTSIEHDHVDIYPDPASYRAAFEGFVARIPEDGTLVAYAADPEVRAVVASSAKCRVVWYALAHDDVGPELSPTWIAAPIAAQGGMQPFDLFVGGTSCGPVLSPLAGEHNVKNALATIALIAETSAGTISVQEILTALRRFSGVRRRQDLLGEARGVRVYDDFAHHPTAVRETLAAIRARHPEGALIAAFEPRSATACRSMHQQAYEDAFHAADLAILAPLGRANVPDAERLDLDAIATAIRAHGDDALAPATLDDVLSAIVDRARPGDTVLLMSNGDFGGLHDRVLAALALRE